MSNHNDVLSALRKITRAIDLHSKKLVREVGLTSPQLLVLKEVGAQENANPSTVAKAVHLSQATVTTILDRLVKGGLIIRERSNSDRRVVDLSLTDDGWQKLNSAPDLLQAGFIQRFSALQEWERLQLLSSIERIAAMMDAEDIDAAPILELGDLRSEEPAG